MDIPRDHRVESQGMAPQTAASLDAVAGGGTPLSDEARDRARLLLRMTSSPGMGHAERRELDAMWASIENDPSLAGDLDDFYVGGARDKGWEGPTPPGMWHADLSTFPGLTRGDTEILYMRSMADSMACIGMNGDDAIHVPKSAYVSLGSIGASHPEEVFCSMQGENWSPCGEARNLILASGTDHTSMSVGDIFQRPDGKAFMVAPTGFLNVEFTEE